MLVGWLTLVRDLDGDLVPSTFGFDGSEVVCVRIKVREAIAGVLDANAVAMVSQCTIEAGAVIADTEAEGVTDALD